MKESQIQSAILDYLAARRILAFRQNTGAVKTEKRFFRFGVPGMADILAFPAVGEEVLTSYDPVLRKKFSMSFPFTKPLWIECKAPGGKQSELQRSFQKQVEAHGHRYIVARSIEDVVRALGAEVVNKCG